ncbi:MAG: hypothetical protein ACLTSX_12020 [Collinsella sp.]
MFPIRSSSVRPELAAEAKAEYAEAKAEVKQKLGRALDQIEKLAD